MNDWSTIIVHADLDAFYASVEELDDPSLADYPLIVGSPNHRGVVLTANYHAREYGLRSAMPMVEALKRCPFAKIVPPRFERYKELSGWMMQAFNEFSPAVEAISLDEAFIDMSGASGLFGKPVQMGQKIKDAVFEATRGLTLSVGVAPNKFVAKVASAFDKPDGLTVVSEDEIVDWLEPMRVSKLWGAGPHTVAKLEQLGLYTIGDIQRRDVDWLQRMLGNSGEHFHALASGLDKRSVSRRHRARSLGHERTLSEDVSAHHVLAEHLRQSAEHVGQRLRQKNLLARGVRVRLKTSGFELLTRQAVLAHPTSSTALLTDAAVSLLDRFKTRQTYRLVGMAVFDILNDSDPVQTDLFADDTRVDDLERTIDAVKDKFGDETLFRASRLKQSDVLVQQSSTLDFINDFEQGTNE